MLAVANRIMKRIRAYGRGQKVFSPKEFLDLGSRAAVDKALSRLVQDNVLRRIGRGLYDWPKMSGILKQLAPPNAELAVRTIAKRDRITVMPDGIVAAHRLGLTNAVPAKTSYVTDGATRILKIGGRTVEFRHARKFLRVWFNRPAAPVVQALTWLGKANADSAEVINILRSRLSDPIKEDLISGFDLLPAWIRAIVKSICSGVSVAL